MTIQMIQTQMIESYEKKIQQLKKKIESFVIGTVGTEEELNKLNSNEKILQAKLNIFYSIEERSQEICPVCLEHKKEQILSDCGHMLCKDCTQIMFTNKTHIHCVICQSDMPVGG